MRGEVRPSTSGQPRGRDVVLSGLPSGAHGPAIPTSGAAAAVFNLTAANATIATYVTVATPNLTTDACPTGAPATSNLNPPAGSALPNRIISALGPHQDVCIYNAAGSIDFIIDVNGWFGDGTEGTHGPTGHALLLDSPGANLRYTADEEWIARELRERVHLSGPNHGDPGGWQECHPTHGRVAPADRDCREPHGRGGNRDDLLHALSVRRDGTATRIGSQRARRGRRRKPRLRRDLAVGNLCGQCLPLQTTRARSTPSSMRCRVVSIGLASGQSIILVAIT